MNNRFDMAKIALSDDMLYARIDVRARNTSMEDFNYAIEQLARVADEIYPEIKPLIGSLQAPIKPPSLPVAVDPILVPPLTSAGGGVGAGDGSGAGSERFKLTPANPAVDSRPVVLSRTPPRYTEEARRNKTQGRVNMRVLVGTDGSVKQARIIGNGLPDGLNEQAVLAAYQIKFKPAMKDGNPVAFWVSLYMEFNLR